MRIGVDCHVLAGKFQGSRTYISNLYSAVLNLCSEHEFLFLGHFSKNRQFFSSRCSHIDYLSSYRWKRLTYQTAPLVKNLGLDVLHSTYISPLILPCNSLLTIHDILYETHPQFFSRTESIRNRFLIKRSAKKAQLIHTISQYTRHALIEAYDLPEGLVRVVPVGVDRERFNIGDHKTAVQRVAEKFHVKDYILSVGRLEPRKNYIGLLYAYSLLKTHEKHLNPLVIVGQKDFFFQSIFDTIITLKLQNDVKIIESVTDDFLPDIYRASRLFVYPSFAEGFGIPPLEAMACGVPVVSSNCSAIPEVIEDAGLLVNPYSYEEIAEAMLTVLTNQIVADELVVKGRRQVEKWSWVSAAQSYLNSLHLMER